MNISSVRRKQVRMMLDNKAKVTQFSIFKIFYFSFPDFLIFFFF